MPKLFNSSIPFKGLIRNSSERWHDFTNIKQSHSRRQWIRDSTRPNVGAEAEEDFAGVV